MSSDEDNQRTVPKLFEVALNSGDEDLRWDAIAALHWRGSREVLDRAAGLCGSTKTSERALGADILGQLGIPERTFPSKSFSALLELLSDSNSDVLYSTPGDLFGDGGVADFEPPFLCWKNNWQWTASRNK